MNYLHIALALGLVGLCALISKWKEHGPEKDLVINSLRAIIQLSFLGFTLTWIFAHNSVAICLAVAMIMTVNSAIQARSRIKSKYKGLFLDNLTATVLSIWPLAFIGTFLIEGEPWWSVDHFLPLIGMLLGNTMNGISMGVDHFTHGIREKKEEVLEWLALGGTKIESTRDIFRRSVRISLTPILNSMLTMGIVSIPGGMTGQILGGSSPMKAAFFQIIIVLLVAVAAYTGSVIGLSLARKRLFNHREQPCF